MAKSEYGAMKGPSGQSRHGKGAEKTVVSKGESDSGAAPELTAVSAAIYKGAVRCAGGGDSALRTR